MGSNPIIGTFSEGFGLRGRHSFADDFRTMENEPQDCWLEPF
jgi:hypothetical protein